MIAALIELYELRDKFRVAGWTATADAITELINDIRGHL